MNRSKLDHTWAAVVVWAVVVMVGAVGAREKPDALVEMVPGVDDKVFGKLALYKKENGVFIEGIIHNLKPGFHGFHVHEKGLLGNKCMDGGPHFNPFKKVHAGPKDVHRHAGDLGNVYADRKGVAKISIFDGHISLHPRDKTFIGKRSFIIHKRPDDLGRGGDDESLRTGNAGGRLSCGIVIVLGHSLKERPPVYRSRNKHYGGHGGNTGHHFGGGHDDKGFGGSSHHDDYLSFDNDFGFGDDKNHGGYGSSSQINYHQQQQRLRQQPYHLGYKQRKRPRHQSFVTPGGYHPAASHNFNHQQHYHRQQQLQHQRHAPHHNIGIQHPYHMGNKVLSYGGSHPRINHVAPSQSLVSYPHAVPLHSMPYNPLAIYSQPHLGLW